MALKWQNKYSFQWYEIMRQKSIIRFWDFVVKLFAFKINFHFYAQKKFKCVNVRWNFGIV